MYKIFLLLLGDVMRYVSGIVNAFGRRSRYMFLHHPGGSEAFSVRDTATGCEVRCTSLWNLNEKIYGISPVWDAVVLHSFKTAKLHDYIVDVQTGSLSFCDDTTVVNSSDMMLVGIDGYKGSVVKRLDTSVSRIELCTWYEILCELCRRKRQSMMSKRFLRINAQIPFQLEFVQSGEAQRYFTKMYMEAMSR